LFEPLREPRLFAEVAVDHVVGTVVWPNRADFSPEFLCEDRDDIEIDRDPRKFVDADNESKS
jgi:hypothetical protein